MLSLFLYFASLLLPAAALSTALPRRLTDAKPNQHSQIKLAVSHFDEGQHEVPANTSWQNTDIQAGSHLSTATEPPWGSAIWNPNVSWSSLQRKHPLGMISNVNGGLVVWADVSYVNYSAVIAISFLCYPAYLIAMVMILAFLVNMCMFSEVRQEDDRQPEANVYALAVPPVVMDRNKLTPFSKTLYANWVLFCRAIPCIAVFGTPMLLIGVSRSYPQEVFTVLTLLSSSLVFFNGVYMVIFAGSSIQRIRMALETEAAGPQEQVSLDDGIKHWVIFPQYKEEVETVAMALDAIAKSRIAQSSICVLLAMEEREQGAFQKADALVDTFKDCFNNIAVSWHPAGLPNHPPGKASNVAWAFMDLERRVASDPSVAGKRGTILTVADADTQFHPGYFEVLGKLYSECDEQQRHLRIWQSPVFHIKNYHRQPMPIVVGTMFTGIQDLAFLSDPNAVRFPYSSYSLSIDLARHVGGWDPEWIAEDWHMGIKCFLLTMGRCSVHPVLLPTCNYTPEDDTWWKTVQARWSQAKRHALGFSDLSYYFMMLPLMCVRILDGSGKSSTSDTSDNSTGSQRFWAMHFYGLAVIVRLVNVHVIIGLITTYGALQMGIKVFMFVLIPESRHVNMLVDRTGQLLGTFTTCWVISIILVTLLFNWCYMLLANRMDGEPWKSSIAQWIYSVMCFVIFGPFYFLGLGFAIWKAAIEVLVTQTFEYEVAAKPTSGRHL